jgi:ABC-type uncharacterized transport system substrate-binding protein
LFIRLTLLIVLVFSAFAGSSLADVKSILIITWRGQTAAEEGFMSKLEELGVEAKYEFFDAGRDQDKLAGFLRENQERLKSKDLIYTFGTTTALTTQNFDFGGVPHVFNIVTDPVAVGIAEPLDSPDRGSTGAKLSLPPDVMLDLLEQIYPFEKIAILFDPREPNAVSEVDQLTAITRATGKQPIRLRFTPDAAEKEIQIASLAKQIKDADIVFVASTSSFIVNSHLLKMIIPPEMVSVSSSSAYLGDEITLAFGTEYRERGEAVAILAADILLNNASPNDIPIDEITAPGTTIFINKNSPSAGRLDLTNATNKIVYK